MPDLETISKFINTVGLPIALVVAAAALVWYVIRLCAPHVPTIVAAHTDLTNSLKTTTERQADAAELSAVNSAKQTEILDEMRTTIHIHGDGLWSAANALEELATTEEQRKSVRVHTELMRRKLDKK